MPLYHKDIYLPEPVRTLKRVNLSYRISGHARKAAETDRYGVIEIAPNITFEGKDVVEAEVKNGKVEKLVVRLPYDKERDVIYVVGIYPDGKVLKTVWANLSNDLHSTLRRELYDTK
jgi:hypothetical protein